MESGLVQLVLVLIQRMYRQLGRPPLDQLVEYVLNNANIWTFPEVPGETPARREIELSQWNGRLASLDTAILSLLGEQEIPDDQIATRLDEILASSLWERRLNRVEDQATRDAIRNGLLNRAQHVFANSTARQRRGYFLAGVGLNTGHALDGVAAAANELLVQANGAMLNGDDDAAIAAITAFAERVFEVSPFTPDYLPQNWRDILNLWLRGQAIAPAALGQEDETLRFVEGALIYRLPWSRSLSVLITLAIALTVVGIIAYFVTIAWTIKKQQAGAAVVTASPLLMLVVFLIYTSFISCGLTSAGVFLAVLLTNPANSSLGTNLTKPEPLTVTLTVDGKTVVPENEDAPFRITSGQQNFGCEENRNFSVEFSAPQNATLIGQASATFLNFSNAKIAGGPAVNQNATSAAASGVLRGLDYQSFPLGIKNCPGGGHGELVLSGVYRSTVNHEQDVTRILTNDLTTATSEPVWVTLPDFAVSNVKAVCKPKAGLGREYTATVSASQTTSSDGPFQVTYLVDKKQIGLSFR